MPVDRLAMRLYAAGVRSMSLFLAHVPPQHTRSPHHRSVCGPQSAIVTETTRALHRLVIEKRWPHVRRSRVSPHLSGLVIEKHASEVLGHAHCRLPELHVPHAPLPVPPHGPHAVPQQNHVVSAVVGASMPDGA